MEKRLSRLSQALGEDMERFVSHTTRDGNGVPRITRIEMTLSPQARERIREDLAIAQAKDPRDATAVKKALERTLPTIRLELAGLSGKGAPGILILEGLPEAPDVPAAQNLALALGRLTGMKAFQFSQQNHGETAAVLKPQPGAPSSSSSSRTAFGPHSDDPPIVRPLRVERILLLGHVNENLAQTGIAPLDSIRKHLGFADFRELLKPQFNHRLPPSISIGGGETWSNNRPILYENRNGVLEIQFDEAGTRSASKSGQAAIEALNAAAHEAMEFYTLKPGSALIFDNFTALHSRTAFEGERIVIRVYLRSDLKAWREISGTEGITFDIRKGA